MFLAFRIPAGIEIERLGAILVGHIHASSDKLSRLLVLALQYNVLRRHWT